MNTFKCQVLIDKNVINLVNVKQIELHIVINDF